MGLQAEPSICYHVLCEEAELEMDGLRREYSIIGLDADGVEVFHLVNVTANGDFAKLAAKLLTVYHASAIHAKDIIEDLVAEYDPELPYNDSMCGNLCSR